MASPQLQGILQLLRQRPAEPQDLAQQRAAFEGLVAMLPGPPGVLRQAVDAGGVPGEWISVNGAADRVIYYLHGGGYTIGSVNTHAALVARLCQAAGARSLSVNYRLAPEHPFPAAVEDAVAGYRWLLEQEVDPARTVIAGDSAGGGLTVATLVALRDHGLPLTAAGVCLSPWVDLEGLGDSIRTKAAEDPMIDAAHLHESANAYLAGADPRTPLAAPLHADLSGLPPLLVQVGSAEVLLDDSRRLAERASAAGVEVTLEVWDEMIHVWHFMAGILPEGQQAIDRIGQFVGERVPEKVAQS